MATFEYRLQDVDHILEILRSRHSSSYISRYSLRPPGPSPELRVRPFGARLVQELLDGVRVPGASLELVLHLRHHFFQRGRRHSLAENQRGRDQEQQGGQGEVAEHGNLRVKCLPERSEGSRYTVGRDSSATPQND